MYRCVLVVFLFFYAKSDTTNTYRSGLSDISYKNPFSCDLNLQNISKNSPSVEKNRFAVFDFSSIFERVK